MNWSCEFSGLLVAEGRGAETLLDEVNDGRVVDYINCDKTMVTDITKRTKSLSGELNDEETGPGIVCHRIYGQTKWVSAEQICFHTTSGLDD